MGAKVIQQNIVIDRNVITSWNPSTAIDVAFKLLECVTSVKQTDEIKKLMGFLRIARDQPIEIVYNGSRNLDLFFKT